jgi:hypothetical protein
MNFSDIKHTITHHLINIPGWHTNRKIVVIESDDWGSIRMPSKEVYDHLLSMGIRVDKDPYCKYDSLATGNDLENLFDVLTSVKDKNGRNACLTANTLVANPDFDKIKASGFEEYFFESFIETLNKYPNHSNSWAMWQQGMKAGIFHPQFHGREHLNVKKWMKSLKEGNEIMHVAFENGTFGLTPAVNSQIKTNYMGAFNSGLKEDIESYKTILKEGLDLFEKIFKYRSLSFISTRYTWHPNIECTLKKEGVEYLQGMIHQRIPIDDDTSFKYKKNNYLGKKSKSGMIYLTRNAYFEPSQHPDIDWVDDCMNRIKIAFCWHRPAIISMHRLNVIGSIDISNRDKNLKLLKNLLVKIVRNYPNVEFMSSDELGKLIEV